MTFNYQPVLHIVPPETPGMPSPGPEITPYPSPEPEIPPPSEPVVPGSPQGPEITPDPSLPEYPQPAE